MEIKIRNSIRTILDFNSLFSAHVIIASIFISISGFFILTGYAPIHDAISWHGVFHFFYSSIEKGIFPYWNPYSQVGTPFYVYCQSFGLLEPSNFLFVLIQKITGCTTFTAYILHYMFYFYVFIIGTYYVLRVVTNSNSTSLLFSFVLFLACFPMFMRQNGALNSFFLTPLIIYFILLFFREADNIKKGFYFFIASYLFSLTLNIYIPAGVMFTVLVFVVFAFLFRLAKIRACVSFMKTRQGLFLSLMSVLVVLLISLPLLALYYSFNNAETNEMFPSVRIFQKNGNSLVELYVSDLKENLFSEKFTNNIKTSNNLWNIIGLAYEPLIHFMGERLPSEIFLYISMLPLLCIIAALKKGKGYAYVFLAIAFLTLLLMTNFKKEVLSQPVLHQWMITEVIPFLKTVEVLQNFGPLFLLCILVIGAVGFSAITNSINGRFIWSAAAVFVFIKNSILGVAIYLFVKYKINFLDPSLLHKKLNIPHERIALVLGLLLVIVTPVVIGVFLIKRLFPKVSGDKLRTISVIFLLADLLIFYGFHSTHFKIPDLISYEKVLENKYYEALKHEDLLKTRHENIFVNYRKPFSVPTVDSQNPYFFSTFWGHEVYGVKKIAFPNALKVLLSDKTAPRWDYFPRWDHFYMTKYYYDYIVNILPSTQLLTSSVKAPILNFFPDKNAIFVDNKYEVVKKIDQMSLKKLGKYIFIEKDKDKKLTSPDVSDFFDSRKYLKYSKKELSDFNRVLNFAPTESSAVNYEIKDYNVNKLSLVIDAPGDGYFYFGDGYSKDWKAYVDHMQSEIYKTNINFKSVYVTKGRHKIDFIFDPVLFRYSLYAYFAGNLLALSIIALYFVYTVRRRAEA